MPISHAGGLPSPYRCCQCQHIVKEPINTNEEIMGDFNAGHQHGYLASSMIRLKVSAGPRIVDYVSILSENIPDQMPYRSSLTSA